ncbi:MAG: ABC transporter ATP-binding protein [Saprospiraceae bacterium]
MNAIEIENLDFSYSTKETLLQNVNMTVPQGSIYGFLGVNGAGKTTLLKLILNLLKSKGKGSIKVLGKDTQTHHPQYLSQIGSLIEEASIYKHLTAKENLKLWSNYHNTAASKIEEVLETVGLSHATNKKVQAFSTGMKQRLGIGITLMHEPKILILDEPTNGLDPIGINDLRDLLHTLSAQGKTIILSSHILPEVEKLVDHVGILKQGSIIYEGTLKELNNSTLLGSSITARVENVELAKQHLDTHFNTTIVDGQLKISIETPTDINRAVRLLIDNDIQLHELTQEKKSLESIFLNLAK